MAAESQVQALERRAFVPLPVGQVTPRGWLRRQLEIQRDGLTANLDEIWPDLADNAWLGGERDGWERGPYYADGLVPLAFLLDDDDLKTKATEWAVGFIEAQADDGWFTPKRVWKHADPDDPWPQFVICKVLRQYYEATGDERAKEAISRFAGYLLEYSAEWTIEDWARMRWMDMAMIIHWLYEQDDEEWLLDVVDLLIGRGFDWTDHFIDFKYEGKQREDHSMATHVVNNAMGLKAPAVIFRQRQNAIDRRAVFEGIENLDRYHGQVTGVYTGDEHFSGKNPAQGTELCGIVEYMFTLEYLTSVLGDVQFGDKLERIAYNALPAAFTEDMWAHQYDQQVNQPIVSIADRAWTNGASANIFGQGPNFGCCYANFHQGWPKFTQHLWMRRRDGGIAATAYGPSDVTFETGGNSVTIIEQTAYPFEDSITFEIECESSVAFPFSLRIPEWTEAAAMQIAGEPESHPEPGQYVTIDRRWTDGETVTLTFDPDLEVDRRYHGAMSVRRGPLVFSHSVASERKLVGGEPPHGEWEYYPTEVWNYALDPSSLDAEDLERSSPGQTPFSEDDPPVRLPVEARTLSEWGLRNSRADEIPRSPTRTDAPPEQLTLVPYGATTLRITEFPILDLNSQSE